MPTMITAHLLIHSLCNKALEKTFPHRWHLATPLPANRYEQGSRGNLPHTVLAGSSLFLLCGIREDIRKPSHTSDSQAFTCLLSSMNKAPRGAFPTLSVETLPKILTCSMRRRHVEKPSHTFGRRTSMTPVVQHKKETYRNLPTPSAGETITSCLSHIIEYSGISENLGALHPTLSSG